MNTTARDRLDRPDVLLKGYCIDLLEMLENDLGFNSQLYIVEDLKFGSRNKKTKKWNGLIADLYNGVSFVFYYYAPNN